MAAISAWLDSIRKGMVLVHGIPGSAATWRPVAERLAIDYRVLVPDLLGFGATGGKARIDQLRADAQAAALADALDLLDITAAVIVGHDFGGPVALHLLSSRSRASGSRFDHRCDTGNTIGRCAVFPS